MVIRLWHVNLLEVDGVDVGIAGHCNKDYSILSAGLSMGTLVNVIYYSDINHNCGVCFVQK